LLAVYRDGRWTVDAGSVHGIPAPTPDDAVELALFAGEASDEDLTDPARACARARLAKVEGSTSQMEIVDGTADPAAGPFRAVITHLPTARLRVKLEGDPRGVDLGRKALASSVFLREPTGGEAADFRLIARRDQYLIAKPDDDRPLVGQIDGYTDASARQAVERLEHIERWKSTAELDNPATSIRPVELKVEILHGGKPLTGSEIRLEYTPGDGDEWVNPEITIRLENTGNRTLYVGLLDLPQTFGIFPMLSDIGSQRLAPGEQAYANRGEPIQVTVPDELWRRGVAELKDIVKVIVSTREFDARRLAQEDLDQPKPSSRSAALKGLGVTRGIKQLGTLERLMERVQTRHAGPGTAKRIDDWRTLQFAFTTVRPLSAGRLDPGRGVTLTDGVRIEPHPALRAGAARLTTMPVATRAVGRLAPLPRLLYDDPRVVQPFEFGTTRAVGGVLNVLELSEVADPRVVTPDQPLRLTIPRPLGPGEHVLPVAFDGEFYLPLGRAESAGGETHVILDRLPSPTSEQTRSLGGALRILFHKVIARAFGTEYHYPILAVAAVGDDFQIRYEPDPAAVRAGVAKARRIALFVHGIIGDTREMAASLHRAGVADRYDLVLTFDYENIQDPISETARALKSRLEASGLTPGHGKSLDIIAHSMGGLVSRWFIEREGGNAVVRRLIMLGTPNGGSPWPCVEDWATTVLAAGLNGLSMVLWPASVLAGLVQAIEAVDVALDQMLPDSNFLKDLYTSPDPKIPYLMIAGNTSLIPTAADEPRRSKLRRLLARLWSNRTKYDVADLFFGGAENDIAVSVESMRHLADGRESACEVRPVASDHISYFRDPATLKTLTQILSPAVAGSQNTEAQPLPVELDASSGRESRVSDLDQDGGPDARSSAPDMAVGPARESAAVPGAAPARRSPSDLLSRFLGRLLDEDILSRSVTAIVAIAIWVILCQQTLDVTRQVASLVNNQDPFVSAYPTNTSYTATSSSYALSPASPPFSGLPTMGYAYAPPAASPPPSYFVAAPPAGLAYVSPQFAAFSGPIMAAMALFAALPVLWLWLSFLGLTRHSARILAESVLEWPIRREKTPTLLGWPGRPTQTQDDDDRTGVVVQFLRWITFLAVCYLAILSVYVVGRGLMAAAALAQPQLQATPPSLH
jgi:hypothetical protein